MKHHSFESSINERWHTISCSTCKECAKKGDCFIWEVQFKMVTNIA